MVAGLKNVEEYKSYIRKNEDKKFKLLFIESNYD